VGSIKLYIFTKLTIFVKRVEKLYPNITSIMDIFLTDRRIYNKCFGFYRQTEHNIINELEIDYEIA